ncbi:MAG: efflux RND transporter permease subunit [Myxococcota bacterium]
MRHGAHVIWSRFVQDLEDLEATVVVAREHTPIRVRDVGRVSMGPALRRGALDDEGAPAVGGVVVARYRANPLSVISAVKKKIAQIQTGLPRRVLEDGTTSQVTIVPFYDRTTVIEETIGTLSTALYHQILITLIVVLILLRSIRGSMLMSLMLPLGVLCTFVIMKLAGVDANVMALGGIAIAIGTMVDIGIVFIENIHQHLDEAPTDTPRIAVIRRAAAEVAPAVTTSVLTTVVSFLPVFGLSSTELKLFAPLAFTKTFAMTATLLLAVVVLPAAAMVAFRWRRLVAPQTKGRVPRAINVIAVIVVTLLLASDWAPLGRGRGSIVNILFVGGLIILIMGAFRLFETTYPRLLFYILRRKAFFLAFPAGIFVFGIIAWLGFDTVFGFLPHSVKISRPVAAIAHAFPGFGREYMPPFDEGAYLYMPSTMSHASIGEGLDMLSQMDAAIAQIPEIDRVVGKLGRVDSALDPAPLSMFETVVTYRPESRIEANGERVRQWRDQIRSPQDIWNEIVKAAQRPGVTGAPMLMPINARIVMLQSGMRAPMGIKVRGPSLQAIESFGLKLEEILKTVPSVRSEMVFADRVVGKPYLEIDLNREAIGRYGLTVVDVQNVLQVALGGMTLTRTVEGRERYPVRVRYMREERDSLEALGRVFVPTPSGEQIPLTQLSDIRYVRGPQVIRSEDTFITSYVLFDRQPDFAEVDVVERAQSTIQDRIKSGELIVPAGISFEFSGAYQNQVRSEKRLKLLIPLALIIVFILLHLQFRRVSTSLIIYTSVAVAVSGGFTLLWLYGQPWFLNFELLGTPMRELFRVGTVNMSVAVWIGFIALVGLATDDGVIMSTYLKQRFDQAPAHSVEEIRRRTLEAGARRVRPCLMTTATTLLALLPVITSQGRGSDIMVPMALPCVGGMAIELLTLFVVPVLYCAFEERKLRVQKTF